MAYDAPPRPTLALLSRLRSCDVDASVTGLAWTLSFKGAVTAPFSGQATTADIKGLLEALPTVGRVSVSYSSGVTFCKCVVCAISGL